MNKILIAVVFVFSVLFFTTFVSAQSCLTITATTISEYLDEIPSLNSQLDSCTIAVESNIHSLVGDGNVLISVDSNQFYLTLDAQRLAGIAKGKPSEYSYEVRMSEKTFNSLLTTDDVFNDILRGINSGAIIITANSFWGKVKWFFAKWFLPKPGDKPNNSNDKKNDANSKRPDNCDETYLPGHREYAANKEKWDEYSANTKGVCQSQINKPTPSGCAHMVQLSIEGRPYYLCWYK